MINRLRDDILDNQMDVIRYESEAAQEQRERVKQAIEAIVALVALRNPWAVTMLYARQRRMEALLADMGTQVRAAYGAMARDALTDSGDLADIQVAAMNHALGRVMNDGDQRRQPRRPVVDAADIVLFGASLKAWFDRQAQDLIWRVRTALQNALARDGSLEVAVAALQGLQGSAEANADALIRSFVGQVAATAAMQTYRANPDVVTGLVQVSVMDSRTSAICRRYNGATWDLDGSPILGNQLPFDGGTPRHWGCRSIILPLVNGEMPSDTTFEDWLNSRSEERQRDILRGRYGLWRRGALSPADALDQRGNPITIDEIRSRYG
ncbi:hypothetical protein JFK97_05910 [Chromobacterium phragmitis]|uniref:phage head morphogenesis protein n=1 Tax=Chromobacterium amazonense TaxID=1382803 RepID=UPI0021B7FA7D|nr:phage head morphogenesis protein [Chromobacterium amazonense]MBM2883920.1 hypothetical protein [Chromobacterium amazonense]MDE1711837.1 phage head morphogenesis protein [Chromobacterium amazonense]